MTLRILRLVVAGWLAGLAIAFAQPAASQSATGHQPQCAFQRKNYPSYILWVCNPDGTAASVEGTVLWLRTNAAGAEVLTSVWHGSSAEMVKRAEAIISGHSRVNARCRRYVHLARAERGAVTWNLGPPSMTSAIREAGRGRRPAVCYAPEPGAADFVVVWSERPDHLPNAFTVNLPGTALGPDEPGREPARTPEPSARVVVNVHRVEPGMDNSLLRLGLTVFSADSAPSAPGAAPPLVRALRFLGDHP